MNQNFLICYYESFAQTWGFFDSSNFYLTQMKILFKGETSFKQAWNLHNLRIIRSLVSLFRNFILHRINFIVNCYYP